MAPHIMATHKLFARARESASALERNLKRWLRSAPRRESRVEVERKIEEFERLSGSGHSAGWRLGRDEIHKRR